MNPLLNLFSLVLLLPLAVSAQNFNVTVNETDTTQITFGGGAGNVSICNFDKDGNLNNNQPGCYNVYPQPPCTEFAAMGQQNTSFASWKFKGSELYIRSLLTQFSPIFNIDIDGKIAEADGAQIGKDSRAFDCFNLFSVQGLDPNVEHTVNLTVKGPSPNRNKTLDIETGPFSLISYTYTTNNQTNTSQGSQQRSGNNGSPLLLPFPEIMVLAVFMTSALYLGST